MNQAGKPLAELRIDRDATGEDAPRRRWWVWVLLLLVGAGVAWAFYHRPVDVRTAVARAVEGAGPRTLLNASGYVTARREATVSSKVTGRVVEVAIEEGVSVEEGQVLARLDATNARAALGLAEALLASAQAALAETRVRLDEAQRELRRVTALVAGRIATEADLDRAEAEVRSLEARLGKQAAEITVAERELAVRQQDLEDTIIRAPFRGMVTVKSAQPGEMISPISAGGGFTRTGICTLVDMTSLEIEVDVNESFIQRVTSGQPVEATLDAYADWRIPGHVLAVIPTADRQKSTVKVRIGFAQLDPRILPEMAVRVAFQGGPDPNAPTQGVLVPRNAVRREDGRDYVWRVEGDRATRRSVNAGTVVGEDQAILEGLEAGDRVVIEGAERLREGVRVREPGRPDAGRG